MTSTPEPNTPEPNTPGPNTPVPSRPTLTPAAGLASELDRAVADVAAALPELPLAEHHDGLAAIHELLQRALDEVRADR